MPVMLKINDDIADLEAAGFAANQIPVWDGDSFEPSSDYQRKYTRTVVVDAEGKGDFTSVKAACDYILTQERDSTHKWLVLVCGRFTESAFTLPMNTTLQGVGGGPSTGANAGITFSQDVSSGGTIVAIEGSGCQISDLYLSCLIASGLTGDVVVFSPSITTTFNFTLLRCLLSFQVAGTSAFNLTLFSPNAGATGTQKILCFYSSIGLAQSGTGTAALINTNGNRGAYTIYWCIITVCEAITTGNTVSNIYLSSINSPITTLGTVNVSASQLGGVLTGNIVFDDRTVHNNSMATWIAGAATQTPVKAKGAASQSANLFEGQNSDAAVQWGIGPTGQQKTNQIAAATGPVGNIVGKEPVYDTAGTLLGYRAIYDTIP
jgi:hypothetical protein